MAQPQAYYPDGTPVPAEEWEQAVQTGQARWQQGTEIKAVRPDGQRVTLSADQYQDALASGYRIATPEEVSAYEREREFGTLGQAAIAGAEGVARGLTFGLSDQVGREVGGEDWAERAAARQEVNPGAATVGEVAGAVGGIFATGGTGGIARGAALAGAAPRAAARLGMAAERSAAGLAARLAERGAAGRITGRMLQTAAGGAAEGALYGVGQAITDNALRDAELSAEKILSSAAEGALIGGVTGGLFGGALSGATIGAERVGAALTQKFGSESTKEALQKFAERRAFKQVVGNYKKPVTAAAAKGEGTLERAGRKLLNEKAPIRKLDEFIPWVEKRIERSADELKSVASKLDAAGTKLDGQSLLRRADEVISSYRSRHDSDFKKVARRLEEKIRPLREALDPKPPKGAKTRYEYDPVLGTRVIEPKAPPPREFSFSEFWKLRQDLDKTIFSRSSQGKGKTIQTDALRELRDAFRAEIDDMVERGQGPLNLKGAWKKASEDYGDFALLEEHAREFAESRQSNRSISLTDYLAGVGGATQGGISGIASAGAATIINKTAREQGNYWLATMADRLSKFEVRFEAAAQALAGLRKFQRAVAPVSTTVKERFAETKQQVEQLSDPQQAVGVLARVSEGFEDRPDIVQALHARVLGDAQYLKSQMPQTLTRVGASLTPQAEKTRLSPVAMRSFMAKATALADPLSVVESLADGKLDLDGIEALKQRRPKVFDALRQQVMIYTAQRKEALPYQRRILLGLAFDFTSDEALQPENLAAIQQAFAEREQPEQQGPARQLRTSLGPETQLPAERAIGGNA